MKLTPLTGDNILQAAATIDREGIPRNRVWSEYYAVVNQKEYPFKYLVYLALHLAGVKDVKFESTDGYRNYLERELGFPIVYYKGGYNFFTKEELDYFSSIIGKPYRKAEPAHRAYPNKLNALIAKVNYWASSVLTADYKLKKDTNWLTGFTANIKPYMWPRIYKDKDHDIFFNVEVNGKNRFIGYKLDGYYETKKQLKPAQVRLLDEFKTEIGWEWPTISFDAIGQYDWARLIRETKDYISRYDHHFDHLKKRLYKQKIVMPVSWNTNGWQRPSGHPGFAGHSFDYDEWLFNSDLLIGQDKYAGLAAIAESPENYRGKVFDISLVTCDPLENKNYLLATLRNVEVIGSAEAAAAVHSYERSGWLQEMKDDLEDIKLDAGLLERQATSDPFALFNIKFNVQQLGGLPLTLLPAEDLDMTAVSSGATAQDIINSLDEIEASTKAPFSFGGSGSTEADLKKRGRRRSFSVERELEFKHNELQKKLLRFLQAEYTKPKVRRECKAFGGCRIDIVRETDDGYIFYEIKTYNHLLTSIRLGIGQLLEYNLFPKSQQAKQMILVSHLAASSELKAYILHLKSFINLPFTYMHFDLEKECIVSEI
jgi:hypothetical protein